MSAGEGKGGRPDVPNGKRNPLGPIPVPTTDDDLLMVDQTICDCWEALGRPDDVATIRACAGETLHPDVAWPPIPEDHETVKAVWDLLTSRTQAFVAVSDKAAWCAGLIDVIDPLEVLEEWVSLEPTPGKFYEIGTDPELTSSDTMSRIARKALNGAVAGAGNNSGNRLDYIHCVTSGPRWNWRLYASSNFTQNYPEFYGVNGKGLRMAFMPYNDDARAAIANRRYPTRGITQGGQRIPGVGSSYGLLWLPPVDPQMLDSQGIVTCGSVEWSDGSSSIDPPPEILNGLQEGA
jgi:hypothetical protein